MQNNDPEMDDVGISPRLVTPGGSFRLNAGKIAIEGADITCRIGDSEVHLNSVRKTGVSGRIPDDVVSGLAPIRIFKDGDLLCEGEVFVGETVCDGMHIVANPAIDPLDGAVVVTKSGSRGHMLDKTLFRIDDFGVNEMDVDVMNPTGLDFDENGILYVTNRADGTVVRVDREGMSMTVATDLGVATGLVFSSDGTMFVGDRSGTIFRLSTLGDAREFATLDSSVSAYHLAFDADENLYVSAPGLCSYDSIYRIDKNGEVSVFYKGLGRPQGLAFDSLGNLFAAACLRGRHGVVRIDPTGTRSEHIISGSSVVGLCFDKSGDLLVANSESVYRFPAGQLPE